MAQERNRPGATATERQPTTTTTTPSTPPPSGSEASLVGYARVSTRGQDLALQLSALEQAGCARVFQDVGSGTIRHRPELARCLDYLRAGDTLVVWRLDRLGRSLRHLVEIIADLETRQIAFRSLRESIDTTTAAGRLQLHLFAALAEFERELIRERSQASREIARAAGRLGGRPRKVTEEKIAAAIALRERGELTMTQIAASLGISRRAHHTHLDLPTRTPVHAPCVQRAVPSSGPSGARA